MGYRTTWGIFSAAEVGAPHQRKRVFILADRDGGRGWEDFLPTELRSAWTEQPPGGAWPGSGATEGREVSGAWPSRPGEPQHGWEPPRVVVDAKNRRQFSDDTPPAKVGRWSAESGLSNTEGTSNERRRLDNASGNGHRENDSVSAGREGAVDAGDLGNAKDPDDAPRQSSRRGSDAPLVRGHDEVSGQNKHRGAGRHSAPNTESLAEPPLGRDSHGTPNRLDHAELYVTCDNRTDELRLLGNGVVPATAERAFRVLMAELALP
jgi:DNA (cytosine-5)-methyltransferase 1